MKYARVNGTDVFEICTPIVGFTIDQCFHPDIVAQLIPCSDEVTPEWTYVDGQFVAPVVEETTPEEPTP
jgi:hypothetical protein